MSNAASLPNAQAIKAFFVPDKSVGRFLQFLKQYVFDAPVTLRTCATVVAAAYSMNTPALPSPACNFFMDEDVELGQDHPVRQGSSDTSLLSPHAGPPAGTTATFGWLLVTRRNPGLTTYNTVEIRDVDFKALTAVLATATQTSYRDEAGAMCDGCTQGSAALVGECRMIGAQEFREDLGLGCPHCTNCFAAGVECQWHEEEN